MHTFSKLNLLVIVGALVFSVGCSIDEVDTEARQRHWAEELEKVAPVGTDIKLVQEWLKSQGFDHSISEPEPRMKQEGRYIHTWLEHIELTGNIVCADWSISATINMDEYNKVTTKKIDGQGNCL